MQSLTCDVDPRRFRLFRTCPVALVSSEVSAKIRQTSSRSLVLPNWQDRAMTSEIPAAPRKRLRVGHVSERGAVNAVRTLLVV